MPPDLVIKRPIMRRPRKVVILHRPKPFPLQRKPFNHPRLRTKTGQHPPLALDILNTHPLTATIQKSARLKLSRRRSPIQRKLPNIRKPAQSKRQRVMIRMPALIRMRIHAIRAIRHHRLANRRHIPRRILIRNFQRPPARRIESHTRQTSPHLRPPRRAIVGDTRIPRLRGIARMQRSRVRGMQYPDILGPQNREAPQSLIVRMRARNQYLHTPILLHSRA